MRMEMSTSRARRSQSPFLKRLVFIAGILVLAGVSVSVLAVRHAGRTDSSPIVPTGNWLWVYRVSLALAFAAYVVGVVVLEQARPRLAPILVLAAAIQLVPLAGPLLLSRDVYFYWDKGRIGTVHDGNPYTDPPSRYPDDPAYRRMGADWYHVRGSYGPTFTVASQLQAAAVGDSPRLATLVYRSLAAGFMLVLVVAAATAGTVPALAAAFVGWNPLFALHFAGGAHNDAWMMALFVSAFALAAHKRRSLGGAAWLLAVGVKWVPLVLLPLHAARRRLPFGWVGAVVALIVLASVSFWRYGTAWLFHSVAGSRRIEDVNSTSLVYFLHIHTGLPARAWTYGFLLVLAVAYGWLVVLAWRGRERLGLTLGILVVCLAWLPPWYALWPAGIAAIEDDRAARWLSIGLTGWLLRDAVPL
jgi:hypothetical protein